MKHQGALAKAREEKLEAKLQQAKAKLEGLAATAKEGKAQAEIDAIIALRAKRGEIEAKIREFKVAGAAKASLIKADIEANVADFEAEVSKLAARLKGKS